MEQNRSHEYTNWEYDKPHDKIAVHGSTCTIDITPNVTVMVAGQTITFRDPVYMRYVADALMVAADWLNSKGVA